jgi:hypothetical protein
MSALLRTKATLLIVSGLLFATLCGCGGNVDCTTEVTDGRVTYTGRSKGKAEDQALRVESVRDACRQKCAIEKAPMVDSCASRCVVDAESAKIGAKTTCSKF